MRHKLSSYGKNRPVTKESANSAMLNLSELAQSKYSSIFEKRSKEHTLLKHAYIYNEYLKVQREMARTFPEIAPFLPKKYFYLLLAYRFSLTPNYVCSVISNIRRRTATLKHEIEIAKRKIANDECKGYYR